VWTCVLSVLYVPGVSLCVLLLGLCGVCGGPWWVVLLLLCLLMCCFSLGLGAVTFLLVNEVQAGAA
jgi:ABC-type Co2+ transport system permease subunit